MRDIPIIFSAPMVLALLAGRKTQTRRLALKWDHRDTPWCKVKPGDRLWVKETGAYACRTAPIYRADGEQGGWIWSPSIHCPRWASRITLIVTATKIERLQAIREDEALAEGVQFESALPSSVHRHFIPIGGGEVVSGWSARECFSGLWEHLHGPNSWGANPEVVAITFRPVLANIDAKEAQAA